MYLRVVNNFLGFVICLTAFLFSGGFAANESVTANVGEDVTLSCTVNFHLLSSAHIAWKLEDVVINTNGGRNRMSVNDKTSYLTVSEITLQDSGNYTCEVRQSSVSYCEVFLYVLAPPTDIILTDSRGGVLRDGEKVEKDIDQLFSLSCCTGHSGSYPRTQIEWLFYETFTIVEIKRKVGNDESDSRITHTCSNVTLQSTEEYTGLIICAALHEGLKRPLYKNIIFKAKGFTVQLFEGESQNQIFNGTNFYLRVSIPSSLVCQVEGCTTNISFSWYLENLHVTTNDLKHGSILLENEGAAQSIANFVSPEVTFQEKVFKCRAVCGFQAKEVSVNLGVHSLPTLVMPGRPLTEFQRTSISCLLNGSREDHVYRWTIGDKDITENATQRLTRAGNTWMSTLSYIPRKEHNGKLISCKLGTDSSRFDSAQMNVLYGAIILDIRVFPSELVDENSAVNITCDVQSNPIHENVVQWEKFVNGNSKRWIRIRQPSEVLVKNATWYRWVLQLKNVKRDDVSPYRCTATNGIGRFAESDSIHLQLNEMGICLDDNTQFVENVATRIRCLIKRRTTMSIIRWLINDEEDVTRNATSKDIIDDRGRTITESELKFYPLRKYNGKTLTCTSGMEEYSGDAIVLNISYCPNQVTFTKCEYKADTDETLLNCESDMSNPPSDLRLENVRIDVNTNLVVTKVNRYKYTGYITSLTASTKSNEISGVSSNITCCSTTNSCTKVCALCLSMGTTRQGNFSFMLVFISIAGLTVVAFIVFFSFYRFHRRNLQDDVVELPERSNSGGTGVNNRPLEQHSHGPEYANSSSSSSEAIYEHMKDRSAYVNNSGGTENIQRITTVWDCLLGFQNADVYSTEVRGNRDTYSVPSLFERANDDKHDTLFSCAVSTFTGPYQKRMSAMYTTEVNRPVHCELKMKKQISKSDAYFFHEALISRNNIQMKVVVKRLSEDSEHAENLFIEEINALENLENHENVIKILGLCSSSMPYCVIFEFLFETLQENLQALYHSNKLNLHSQGFDNGAQVCLKKMSFDVANGLEYLTRNGFTYPRLVCQNILLDDLKRCKLHDFTLMRLHISSRARNKEQDDGMVAPEVNEFAGYTVKNDVWNYGQLLLNIYSFESLILASHNGSPENSGASLHLENLGICPDNMLQLISSCRNSLPENRPSFKKILETLSMME